MEKTLSALNVATGCFTLASGLSDTVSFLQVLASLYKSSGIRAQRIEKAHVLALARSLQMSTLCDLYLQKGSTPSLKVL